MAGDQQRQQSKLPKVTLSQLKIEERIGEGSFSEVFRVRVRSDLLLNKVSSSSPSTEFALKCPKVNHGSSSSSLSEEGQLQIQQQNEETETCFDDLISEASILSKLSHPNIIKAVATSFDRPAMLLLELLDCTLQDKLDFWRKEQRQKLKHKNSTTTTSLLDQLFLNRRSNNHNKNKLFRSRTEHIVKGIASGMEYLHSQNIILRDLKPENIGFDSNGEVKLFDFGFACCGDNQEECHTVAGSLRYMPPEMLQVATSATASYSDAAIMKISTTSSSLSSGSDSSTTSDINNIAESSPIGSSFASDVYSFGIVLWEIATLEKAFNKDLAKKINKRKKKKSGTRTSSSIDSLLLNHLTKGRRPTTRSIPNPQYKKLVEQCWDCNPITRPSFETICNMWLSKIYPDANDDVVVVDEEHVDDFGAYIYKLYEDDKILKKKKKKKQGQQSSSQIPSNATTTKNKMKDQLGRRERCSRTFHGTFDEENLDTHDKVYDRFRMVRSSTEPMSDSEYDDDNNIDEETVDRLSIILKS